MAERMAEVADSHGGKTTISLSQTGIEAHNKPFLKDGGMIELAPQPTYQAEAPVKCVYSVSLSNVSKRFTPTKAHHPRRG